MAEAPDRRIGGAIARLREERGWSQRALAKVVGLDQSALSRVEAGKRRLAAGEQDVISRALGVSPTTLLAGSAGDDQSRPAPPKRATPVPTEAAGDAAFAATGTVARSADAASADTACADAAYAALGAQDDFEAHASPGEPARRALSGEDLPPARPASRDEGRSGRSRVDVSALNAAVDEADAIFQRLQAERAGAARRGDAGERRRVTQRAGRTPAPDAQRSPRLASPTASRQSSPRLGSPAHGSAPGAPRDVVLPDLAEGVVADWFALRAAAASPRDWEHAGARAVRASGRPVHQPLPHAPEPGVTAGATPSPAAVASIVGQPWSWGMPRDRIARFWRQELHIDPDGAVPDLIPLLEDVAGVEVIVARLGGDTPVCACTIRDGAAFLFVNAARPVVLQRFALAHALGHLALGHAGVVDERIGWGQGNAREGETNDFAEELLVPVAAVARWYDRHGDPTPDVETVVELANAFGVSFWAAMYRSRAARKLNPRRQAALAAELRRLEWQLLPRQALLGGLKDTLSALTPDEVRAPGEFGAPAVLRVPARMRAWALRAVSSGVVSLESAASALRMPAGDFARKLTRAGVE